jgi:glutamate formiminotransferase / 5-formyltetrahydrofolate cyclo-ligase
VLECVVNISEGRDPPLIAEVGAAAGRLLLDVHSDPDHHRSVLTLAGPEADVLEGVQQVAAAAVARLDIGSHRGVHPRIGVLDVVPFVALRSGFRAGRLRLSEGPLDQAVRARDRFGAWAAAALELPAFLYGPERTLPDVRRRAWTDLRPDFGPAAPHPTAGAVAVGARPVLVAYNLWLTPGTSQAAAGQAATRVRGPGVRALGLVVGGGERVQVSINLTEPARVGPGAVHDAVAQALRDAGGDHPGIDRAELVGLLPAAVLAAEPRHRWPELGLHPEATIEARLESAGLDGGSF